MLYDRLLLDLNRAELAHEREDWAVASENLLHAQAIIAELMSSLKVELWDGGKGLLALYTYVSTSLITANVQRDVRCIRECSSLLEPLREAWHEAAGQLSAQEPAPVRSDGALGVA